MFQLNVFQGKLLFWATLKASLMFVTTLEMDQNQWTFHSLSMGGAHSRVKTYIASPISPPYVSLWLCSTHNHSEASPITYTSTDLWCEYTNSISEDFTKVSVWIIYWSISAMLGYAIDCWFCIAVLKRCQHDIKTSLQFLLTIHGIITCQEVWTLNPMWYQTITLTLFALQAPGHAWSAN